MSRWTILVVIAVVGCQGQPANMNPFGPYGPTQIPPPPTGTAGRPDPYYRRSQAQQPQSDGTRVGQLPRTGRSVVTSDNYRSEAAAVADRRPRLTHDAARGSTGREEDADRSSFDEEAEENRLREAQLNWQRPSVAYRDRSTGVRSGMVRPRFGGYDDPSGLIPEPESLDSGLARSSRELRSPAPSAWSSGATPSVAERAPYSGWSR